MRWDSVLFRGKIFKIYRFRRKYFKAAKIRRK